ncbi:ECF-type sigma factor [Thioalkalivibrio sp. XN8]|uniref:ECF-type sigma factor n=1 Tax=Thioalkalivibrio sp. XN8 TaxID=2712863 RepID=UPI0013ED7B8A|nr:ECF-type sigma factor [Thioalkalivibrio sp. XN8]NGP54440.1 sigma-70 family RNA polymerase sigma factor [Thioalkalivibrio sp. XN8]
MGDNGAEHQGRIHALLARVERQEPEAFGELVAIVYPELKRLAHFQLTREQPGHTLNTTAIVHEAYVRMASGRGHWEDRKHFLRAASAVMRHLLVDHARRKRADKRGSGSIPVELEESRVEGDDDSLAVLALDSALKDIAEIDPRLEQIVECRYFAGLSVEDTAEALGVSVRTVERDLQRARAYLAEAMGPDEH